jgi:hypothetical protein
MSILDEIRRRIAAQMNSGTAAEASAPATDENAARIAPGQLPTIRSVGFSIDDQDRFVVEVALRRDYQEVPDSGMVVMALMYADPDYTEVAWYHGRFGDIPENDAYAGRKVTIYMDPDLVEQAHDGEPEMVVGFGVAGNDYYDLMTDVTHRFHRKARKYLLQPRNPGEIPPMLPLPEPVSPRPRSRPDGAAVAGVTLKSELVDMKPGIGKVVDFPFEGVPYSVYCDAGLAGFPNSRMAYVKFSERDRIREAGTRLYLSNPTNDEVTFEVVWLELAEPSG